MSFQYSKISIKKINNLGIISLNCPENYNILSFETFHEIEQALKLLEFDEDVRVIILKAEPGYSNGNKIFSAGVNLKEYGKKFKLIDENPLEFKKILKQTCEIISMPETLKKPVIAGVNGLAVGGSFELILACDLVLVSDKAEFLLSEINLGLIPGYGGIHRLLRNMGKNKVFETVATAKKISAKEAFDYGIAAEIYPDREFECKLLDYAFKLSQKSPHALNLIKEVVGKISGSETDIEINHYIEAAGHYHAKEGITAFLEKRRPLFI